MRSKHDEVKTPVDTTPRRRLRRPRT